MIYILLFGFALVLDVCRVIGSLKDLFSDRTQNRSLMQQSIEITAELRDMATNLSFTRSKTANFHYSLFSGSKLYNSVTA